MLLHGRYIPRKPFSRPGSPFLYASVRDTRTGRIHTISTRTVSVREAEKALGAFVDELHQRETGGIVESVSLSSAIETFLGTKVDLRPVSLRALRYDLQAYTATIGDRRLEDLTPAIIENWWIGLGGAPRTRQKALMALRQLFTWCIRRKFMNDDPTEGLRSPRIPRHEGKALSLEEARSLVAKVSGALRLAVLLALHAGLRIGTILRLQRRDVVGDRLEIPAEAMKGGQPAVLPIHPELRYYYNLEMGFLVQAGGLIDLNERIFDASVIRELPDGLGWHDLRRTFATWHGLRCTHAVLQALLCHAPISVTDLYPQIGLEELRKAVEAMPWLGRKDLSSVETA